MSELKARRMGQLMSETGRCDTEVYLKSEADKEIAELQKQVHDYAQGLYVIQEKAEKEIRHHKKKRCLAMVMWCESNVIWVKGCSEWRRWKKWHNRWLKISEKFKEGV